MSPERKHAVLTGARQQNDFVPGSAGYVYWPERLKDGLSSFDLRVLADELDRINCELQGQTIHTEKPKAAIIVSLTVPERLAELINKFDADIRVIPYKE